MQQSAGDQVKGAAGDVKDAVKDAAGSLKNTLSDVAGTIKDKAGDAKDAVVGALLSPYQPPYAPLQSWLCHAAICCQWM